MNEHFQSTVRCFSTALAAIFTDTLSAMPGGYPTLNGVKDVQTVFDVRHPNGNNNRDIPSFKAAKSSKLTS